MTIDPQIEKIIEGFGATLYDVEIDKQNDSHIFRVLIQRANGGVDLDLCADISRVLSPYLDTNPPLSGGYFLEVSSPGIERPLHTFAHYTHSIGESVTMKMKDAQRINGTIKVCEDGKIFLVHDGEEIVVSFDDIVKAKTVFEWK